MKVLLHCPNPTDATSWYRAVGPFSRMNLDFKATAKATWRDLISADILFVQRPQTAEAVELIKNARHINIPVWVDYDDDLLNIPDTNPFYHSYSDQEIRDVILEALALADVVSVSTPALASSLYAAADISAHIIPNAIDDAFWGRWYDAREDILVWRGSHTHESDLHDVGTPITNWLSEHKNFDVVWFGYRPWWAGAIPASRQAYQTSWDDVATYYRKLTDLAPKIVFVPLEMTQFNAAKSNIAWLEASMAGAVCVASPVGEFVRPGCIISASTGKWFESLELALTQGQSFINESREKIEKYLLLSKVNKHREGIIDQLCTIKSKFAARRNQINRLS